MEKWEKKGRHNDKRYLEGMDSMEKELYKRFTIVDVYNEALDRIDQQEKMRKEKKEAAQEVE